jgi:hypothetical protein
MARILVPEPNRTISRCHSSTVKTRSWQSMPSELPIHRQVLFLWVLRTGPLVTFELMIRKPCLVQDSLAPMMKSSPRHSRPRTQSTAHGQSLSMKLALCLLRPDIMCNIQTWATPTAAFQPSIKWDQQLVQVLSLPFAMPTTCSLTFRCRRLRLGQPHCSDLLRALGRHCELSKELLQLHGDLPYPSNRSRPHLCLPRLR